MAKGASVQCTPKFCYLMERPEPDGNRDDFDNTVSKGCHVTCLRKTDTDSSLPPR